MLQRTLLFTLMVLSPFGLAWAEDWPQWRGPDRTGVSKETGLLDAWPSQGPKLLWTFRDAGAGYSCMSLVGDRLYSMGAKNGMDYVYSIDLNTQKILWATEIGPTYTGSYGPGPRSTPTVDGNYLYAIGGLGDLVCVEVSSGKKVWLQGLKTSLGGEPLPWGFSESPLVDGDLVVATPGGNKGPIASFDKRTGTLKWRCDDCTFHGAYSSMIAIEVGGVRQFVQLPHGVASGGMVGVRTSDGKILWRLKSCTGVNTPIYQNDSIYSCGPGKGCQLVKLTATEGQFKAETLYTNQNMQNYCGGVILVGKYLYGYCASGGWTCQDFKTGKRIWKRNPRLGKGCLTYADGNLYCYHEDQGDVLLLKDTWVGYKEKGGFRIPERSKLSRDGQLWTSPVVANGKLYLRDQDLIFCYDVHRPK